MNRVTILAAVPYVLVFSMPLMLAACTGNSDFFGTSRDSSTYNYNEPVVTSSPGKPVPKVKTSKTTMVEPGVSTVVTPKPASTTSNAAPVNGPMVPGNAPSIGQ